MSFFDHEFEAPIQLLGIGRSRQVFYKVLFLPDELAQQLPFDQYPRLRVVGEIADVPVRGAWQPVGDGRRYFIVSPEVMKSASLGMDDMVAMRFAIDDQDYVEMPVALVEALENNAAADYSWQQLTPGKKRFLAHRVLSAKTAPTIAKRIAEVLNELESQSG